MKSLVLVSLLALSLNSFAEVTREEVSQKTTAAVESAVSYSKERKEDFQKDMETRLSEISAEIENLKNQYNGKSGAVKSELKDQIDVLTKKQKDLKEKIAKLKDTSGKAWTEMRAGVNKAWDSLSDSYKKAKEKFNE